MLLSYRMELPRRSSSVMERLNAMDFAKANTQLLVIPVRDKSNCVNVDVAMMSAPSSAAATASMKF